MATSLAWVRLGPICPKGFIMKNLVVIAAVAALSAVSAHQARAEFYMGAMVGGGESKVEVKSPGFETTKLEEPAFTVAVVGGYETPVIPAMTFTKYAFGALEAYVDATNTVFEERTDFSSTELTNNLQFGLNVLLGARLQEFLLGHNVGAYVLVGPHFEYWEDEASVSGLADFGIPDRSVNEDNVHVGFQVGFGARYIFKNDIGIRGEYRFAEVERIKNNVTRTTSSHEFGLGVTYHF